MLNIVAQGPVVASLESATKKNKDQRSCFYLILGKKPRKVERGGAKLRPAPFLSDVDAPRRSNPSRDHVNKKKKKKNGTFTPRSPVFSRIDVPKIETPGKPKIVPGVCLRRPFHGFLGKSPLLLSAGMTKYLK